MKYIIYNDLSYLYHKKKLILLMIFAIPLLVVMLNIKGQLSAIDIIKNCLGANLDLKKFEIVPLLMFIFNVFIFIYLIVDMYVKDLDDNLENVFLRIRPIKYIVKKSFVFLISVVLIKLVQYAFIIAALFLVGKGDINLNILGLFLTDTLYICLVQSIFLLIYMAYILLKKNVCFLSGMLLVLFILFPKCIWDLRHYNVYIGILILLVYGFISLIFLWKPKKIMENV